MNNERYRWWFIGIGLTILALVVITINKFRAPGAREHSGSTSITTRSPELKYIDLPSGVRSVDFPIDRWADGRTYSFVWGVMTTGNVVIAHYNGGDGRGGWDQLSSDPSKKFYTNALVSASFTSVSPGTTRVYYIIAPTSVR